MATNHYLLYNSLFYDIWLLLHIAHYCYCLQSQYGEKLSLYNLLRSPMAALDSQLSVDYLNVSTVLVRSYIPTKTKQSSRLFAETRQIQKGQRIR